MISNELTPLKVKQDMESEKVIVVKNVSKEFRLYRNPITGPIQEVLMPWRRASISDRFWAVNDVSIEISKGEIVGIIGPNGAGKTTLLKMIAGLLAVDQGSIYIKGKITALLALGVGVHPEFSGRENIYFGGLLLGMTKEEILRKMDEIVEFAELGEFINQPFRTYSSGMKARLLFAISMSIEPDILIVDEALATGDSYFIDKSRRKIQELCKSGATIIFVSHNLSQISELCSRCYFLAEGRILADGDAETAISSYNQWSFKKHERVVSQITHGLDLHGGTGEVLIKGIELHDGAGISRDAFVSGERLKFQIQYESSFANNPMAKLWIGFIKQDSQTWVAEIGSAGDKNDKSAGYSTSGGYNFSLKSEGVIEVVLEPLLLQNGVFALWVIICSENGIVNFCEYKNVNPFFVSGKSQSIQMPTSMFWCPYEASARNGIKN
jgi:ABC-type polysaccharide/polyol phosphate transport system ATPase subunit